MKDAAFSDGIFSNIVVLRNQAPHSDRQNTDLLLHYLLSCLQRYLPKYIFEKLLFAIVHLP